MKLLLLVWLLALPIQHTDDPTECKKVCTPPGWDGELPSEFPEDVEQTECAGDYCSRAGHEPPAEGEDPEEQCKPHYSCSVFCSEVCCVCLRECI